MQTRVLTAAVVTVSLFGSLATALPTLAQTYDGEAMPYGMTTYGIATQQVIKSTYGTALYWFGKDQKKHLFPNTATFYTWFSDMKNVKKVSATVLNKIPTGGNVTYRPGAKLVKFPNDKAVYAVSRYGVLHPLANPTVANALYPNWTKQLHTLSATMKNDYTIGSTIVNAWDFNVSNEYNGVYSPSDSPSIGKVDPASYRLDARVENASVNQGDYVYLYTDLYYAGNPANEKAGLAVTKLYDQWGTVLKTCTGAQYCDYQFQPTNDQLGKTIGYFAATTVAGKTIYSSSVQVTFSNVPKPFSGNVSLAALAPTTDANGTMSVTLQGDINANGGGVYSANLVDGRNGTVLKSCANVSTCDTTVTFSASEPRQNVPFYLAVFDGNGKEVYRAYAYANPTGTVPAPAPTPIPVMGYLGDAAIYQWTTGKVGQPLTVSANLSNSTVPVDQLRAMILDLRTGTVLATCDKTLTCQGTFPSVTLAQNGGLVQATWTNLLTGQTAMSSQMALVVNP
jgi:hypothetical protein